MVFYRILILLTAMIIASVSSALARTSVVNILTADRIMPGYGDLVSNWYTALVLKKHNPNLKVNFYLAPPFREKFKKIEPRFEIGNETMMMPQVLDGINIYSFGLDVFSSNIKPGEDEKREKAFDEQIQKWVPQWLDMGKEKGKEHVCTLAFTTKLDHIIRESKSVEDNKSTTERAAGFFVLNAMRNKLGRFEGKLGQATKIAPLITFDFSQSVGPTRFGTKGMGSDLWFKNKKLKRKGAPVYGLPTSFVNGAMFISERDNILGINRYSAEVDFLGIAYASHSDSVERYLSLVRQFAKDNPGSKILVIIPSHESLFRNSQFKKIEVNSEITWKYYVEKSGLAYTPTGKSSNTFYQYEDPKQDNLYLLNFPDGFSFKDAAAIMKASSLPILVTGTLSLSQALQYDRAIIYEALPHLSNFSNFRPEEREKSFAVEIEDHLQTLLRRPPTPWRRLPAELWRSLRGQPEFPKTFKVIFPSTEIHREGRDKFGNIKDKLFDVTGGQNSAPTEAVRRQFYPSFQKENNLMIQNAVRRYRKELQGGHLFDRVLEYCDKAREHFTEIRAWEADHDYSMEAFKYFRCRFDEGISRGRETPDCVRIDRPK